MPFSLASLALVRRRGAAAFAGLLGTFAAFAPTAASAQYADCVAPALPPSVGFTQASPVLQSHAFVAPPTMGPVYGPGMHRPHGPWANYTGPRRISGLPAYRPFGMPMLSEVGAAIGAGVGAVGAGIGGFADDVLLGPVGTPLCRRG
ncbi:hypothetical protein, partial [Alienimonas chondri]|uniref:hypothetical protein n=1 Tax=Alienimonas chondri TaxID=2681879 RepID=UPI0019D68CF0